MSAEHERILHHAGLHVERAAARFELGSLMDELATLMGRLRPGGNWTTGEQEACHRVKDTLLPRLQDALQRWTEEL